MNPSSKQSPDRHSFVLGHGIDPLTRTIYLVGGVNDEMAFRFMAGFRLLDAEKGPVRVVMNSGGGSEPDGFAIYDTLRMAQNEVVIDCYGVVQSIAALILQAAPRRRMSPECRFMFHNGHLEIDGRVYQGTMAAIAKESDYLTKRYREVLAERSGQSFLQVSRWCNKETYFSAKDAVKLGFADEVITAATVELPKSKRSRAEESEVLVEIDASTIEKLLKPKRKRK